MILVQNPNLASPAKFASFGGSVRLGLATSAILSTGDYRHWRLMCQNPRAMMNVNTAFLPSMAKAVSVHPALSPSMAVPNQNIHVQALDKPLGVLNALSSAFIDANYAKCSLCNCCFVLFEWNQIINSLHENSRCFLVI